MARPTCADTVEIPVTDMTKLSESGCSGQTLERLRSLFLVRAAICRYLIISLRAIRHWLCKYVPLARNTDKIIEFDLELKSAESSEMIERMQPNINAGHTP